MKVKQILSNLTFGELRQVGLGGFDTDGIEPENYPEIVTHLNLALSTIYTRFNLKEKELILKPQAEKTVYELTSEFAFSSGNPDWYIEDTAEVPFTDDILQISAIFDSSGTEMRLNDAADPMSIFTPHYGAIQISVYHTDTLYLIYKIKAPELVAPDEDDPVAIEAFLEQDVFLPAPILEPFLSYVEFRVQKARGGETGVALAREAKNNYEMQCIEVERRGVLNQPNLETNLRNELNGWC